MEFWMCQVLSTFSNLMDKYVKNTCDIWLLGKKTRRIRIWLVFLGIFYFCWVFPDFIDKTMQNANNTSFRGKKMRRFRIWPLFLRIFNLWGSFRTLVTKICKIHMIHHFGVEKCGDSEYDHCFYEFSICGGLSWV